MKIDFSTFNIPKINYINKFNYLNPIKPLPYDSFEKIAFKGENVEESGLINSSKNENVEEVTATNSFEVRNIKNMRCPVCGLIMLTDDQIEEFVKDISNRRGDDLIRTFEKYEDDSVFTGVEQNPPKSVFRPQKQEIVDILKKLARQHPEMALYELVQYEAQKRITSLINVQLEVIDEVEKFIKRCNATKAKKEYARNVIQEFKTEILGESENQFSRKKFIYALTGVASDPKTQRRIIEIAEKLPTSEEDVDSWFVKYSKVTRSDIIARKFVQQSIPTAEHLQPRSKEGGSSIRNYICDCSDCNSKRGNMEFDIWATTIPHFKENLQSYLQEVQNAYDKGLLSAQYGSYIEKVIETIKKLSYGAIILDEPDSLDGMKKTKVMQKRFKKIEEMQNEIEAQNKQRTVKQKEVAKLEGYDYYERLTRIENYKKEIQNLEKQIDATSDEDKKSELQSKKNRAEEHLRFEQNSLERFEEWQDRRVAELKYTVREMNIILEKLSKLQAQIAREKEYKERQKAISKENDFMLQENASIVSQPTFNPKDKSEYENYKYQLELLEAAELMLKRLNLTGGRRNKEKDVIQAGIEKIRNRMSLMMRDDRVVYFINQDKIEQNNALIETIDTVLEEIKGKTGYIKDYNKQLEQLGNKKTIFQLEKELDELEKAKEIQERIKALPELRQEIKDLREIITHNREILAKLRKEYKTMTSEEFLEQINLIYLKGKDNEN